MNNAEIKIEDFKQIVADINELNSHSSNALQQTTQIISEMNNTISNKSTVNNEYVRELTVERDEFKTLADSLIEKLNTIEQDFYKEKENMKTYYQKSQIDEMDFLKEQLSTKDSLIHDLKTEVDKLSYNYKAKMQCLEEKILE